jgi:hypothetical protein
MKADKKGKHYRQTDEEIELKEKYNITLETYSSPKNLNKIVSQARDNYFTTKIDDERPGSPLIEQQKEAIYHAFDRITK